MVSLSRHSAWEPRLQHERGHVELRVHLRRCACFVGVSVELYNGTPLFPGQNEADERDVIFKKLGTPTLATMPKLACYPEWNASYPMYPGRPLSELVPRMDSNALDLLNVSACEACEA